MLWHRPGMISEVKWSLILNPIPHHALIGGWIGKSIISRVGGKSDGFSLCHGNLWDFRYLALIMMKTAALARKLIKGSRLRFMGISFSRLYFGIRITT